MVEELRLSHSEPRLQVLDVSHGLPPPNVARLLQLAPDEKAVHALRLRYVNETPVMLTDAWVPERLGRKLTAAALKKRPLYGLLMAQDVVFDRVVQELGAEAAGLQRARLLQTEVGAPLVKLSCLLHDMQGHPSRRAQSPGLLVSGLVSHHGVRSTDLRGIAARH